MTINRKSVFLIGALCFLIIILFPKRFGKENRGVKSESKDKINSALSRILEVDKKQSSSDKKKKITEKDIEGDSSSDLSSTAKRVVGRAYAVDKKRGTIFTYFISDDIRALWSEFGWRDKFVYLVHDNQVPGHEGELPYFDPEKNNYVLLSENEKPALHLIKFLTWKVKGLKGYFAGHKGEDEAVFLNGAGNLLLEKLLQDNWFVLIGDPVGSKRAYLFSDQKLKKYFKDLQKKKAIFARLDFNGRLLRAFDYQGNQIPKTKLNFKLSVSRPSWYPEISLR